MLVTIRDDTWNALNAQHITLKSERWDYSDIPSGGHKRLKDPPTWLKLATTLKIPPPPSTPILPCIMTYNVDKMSTTRQFHYSDDIMSAITSQITGGSIVYPTVQAQIKENTKAPRHWPLRGKFTGDRWNPRTKGQKREKCCRLMTSSCFS